MKYKYIKYAIATVVLSALGYPVWQYVIKPLSSPFLKLLLNISTLGIQRFKDQIYLEIAKGFHEVTSIEIFVLLNAFLISFFIVYTIFVFIIRKRLIDKKQSKILSRAANLYKKKSFIIFIIVYAIFALVFLSFNLVRGSYINKAVTYYNQLITIIRIDITDQEKAIFDSRFAQIRNKDDYLNLIQELRIIAEKNGRIIPRSKFIF